MSIAKEVIKKVCPICNKEFELSYNQRVSYHKNENYQFCCSRECRAKQDSMNKTIDRPTLKCYICGKEFKPSDDQLTKYNKNPNDIFFCSRSCTGKYSNSKMDYSKRNEKTKKLYEDEEWVAKRTAKTKQTCIEKYGVDNSSKVKSIQNKMKETFLANYGVTHPSQDKDIAAKKVQTAKRSQSSIDGTIFDSKYEADVYDFCIRNMIPIERQIPIQFEYNNQTHVTLIDFKINGILFECKGGHLLEGVFDYKMPIPIDKKIEIYRQNNVIIITDEIGKRFIPKAESSESNGLKYKEKCPYPLIGVDIELFRKPKFPFSPDRPICFYKARVDGKISSLEAWDDEFLRWRMIENRINYVGGFIDNKAILKAMNVTRTCKQPSWFSKTYAKELIKKYITTDKIYDPFAGWGMRCDACKELGKEYYGWDLNTELIDWHKQNNRTFDNKCGIEYGDANNIKIDENNCSVFICPPYHKSEVYFNGQDTQKTECDWLRIVMQNIPNAKEYVMVCKNVDEEFKKFIVEEKVNKSHFGTNKEYVIRIKNNNNT